VFGFSPQDSVRGLLGRYGRFEGSYLPPTTPRFLLLITIVLVGLFFGPDTLLRTPPETTVSWGGDSQALVAAEAALFQESDFPDRWVEAGLRPWPNADLCLLDPLLSPNQVAGARSAVFGREADQDYFGLLDAMVSADYPEYFRNTVLVYTDDMAAEDALREAALRFSRCYTSPPFTARLEESVPHPVNVKRSDISRSGFYYPQRGDSIDVSTATITGEPFGKFAYGLVFVRSGSMLSSIVEIAASPERWPLLGKYLSAAAEWRMENAPLFVAHGGGND